MTRELFIFRTSINRIVEPIGQVYDKRNSNNAPHIEWLVKSRVT